MKAAPYTEEYVHIAPESDAYSDNGTQIEPVILDLENEDTSEYTTEDYLKAYFASVRHRFYYNISGLEFYRNMIIIYPHLPFFDHDQKHLTWCQEKIEKHLKEKTERAESDDG